MTSEELDALAGTDPDEALRIASARLDENPNDLTGLFATWKCYLTAERFGLSLITAKRLVELWPNNAGAWNNMGMSYHGMMDLDEAEKCFRRALRIDPKHVPAMNNLALICVGNHKPGEAIEWADKSLALTKDDQNGVLESRGYACLMLGRWKEGWDGYEAMIGGSYRPIKPFNGEPYWKGEETETLVVVGEQGIGDEISFASIYPSLLKDGRVKNVILETDSRLEGLFRRSFDVPVFGTRFQPNKYWKSQYKPTAHVLSGSIGRYYRLTDESFDKSPFLVADPERRLQWRALLDSLGDKPKIGIAWTGGLKKTFGWRRHLMLSEFLPILRQDATFISLQYKDPSEEILRMELEHGIKVHHWPRCTEAKDYDETAALVAELDLVIAVPTAVADLCGGLGKECWVLTPQKPHWRYAKHVWTNAKLYRQKADWAKTINEVARDLGERCSKFFVA